MTADEKLTLLRAIFKEFAATGDPRILLANLTDDVVYKVSIGPGTPLSGEFRGRDGVAEYFRVMPSAVEHVGFNYYDFLANDEKAVVTGDETLRVMKNGAVFFTEWVVVCTFREDKICHILVVENLGALSQAYDAPHAGPPAAAS
ncbi:nuclear transport factor 2 family protein [Polyangium sp. y55x31]|nr:nuclear transport factor 2 family protein [Polyangium sp. y55x31]